MAVLECVLQLLLLVGVGASSTSTCSSTLKTTYPAPVAASGWSYRLVASGLRKPRSIAFDSGGGLLVLDSGVGLLRLSLRDEGDTCLSVNETKTLIADRQLNHGLALSNDGRTVYVSSPRAVFSYAYDSGAGTLDAASNRTVIANMSDGGEDAGTRTLLMSAKKPGTLIVSRGGDSDSDPDALDLLSGHSQIRSFDLAQASNSSLGFLDGHVLGWGLRNSVGVAEDPVMGGIWSVENSVDQIYRRGKDVHETNPAEELNYHGALGSDYQPGNHGFPLCYSLWSTKGFPDPGWLQVGDQFPAGTNSSSVVTLSDSDCNSRYVPPVLPLQAHAAPLDIKFSPDGGTAYIAFHGSWDTAHPVGYRVSAIAFKNGRPIAQRTDTGAAVDVLRNADGAKCPGPCFRPVGLAWDSKGRLFLSSDSTGDIFVLQKEAKSSGANEALVLFPGRSAAAAVALAAVVAGLLLA